MKNNLDPQYLNLIQDILNNGVNKQDRTGTGTRSIFGKQIRHKMSDGFPLLTTKKMAWKSMVTELVWFLRGDTDVRFLWKYNNHIWDGDWYKNYCRGTSSPYSLEEMIQFGLEWGDNPRFFHKSIWDLGPIYGKQWRDWGGYTSEAHQKMNGEKGIHIKGKDQFYDLINDLINNPDSRRLIVNAWNVGELDKMTLPPCHYGFQLYTRELNQQERFELTIGINNKFDTPEGWSTISWSRNKKWNPENKTRENILDELNVPKRSISLIWNQRSVDTGLGLPFNIASYGLLLEIIGKMVNMVPDELIGNLGDTHIYSNHIEPIQEQLGREPYKLPKLKFDKLFEIDIKKYSNSFNNPLTLDMFISRLSFDNFTLEGYESHPTIKLPLSN